MAKIIAWTQLNIMLYVHTWLVFSNLYLDILFTPQRTQYDSIRKAGRSVYCNNWTCIMNRIGQKALF